MAFSFFKKDKSNGGETRKPQQGKGDSSAGEIVAAAPKRDPRKARRWFEHAAGVNDHDFAIECYIHGLEHEPDNMAQHEALHEVAKRRKVAGGKPMPWHKAMAKGGKDPVQRLLHAERLWAMNPLDVNLMVAVMDRAVEANDAEQELNLGELAYWVGEMILQNNFGGKSLPQTVLLQVRNLFVRIGSWDKAVEACKMALAHDPANTVLLQELKNLEAERTIAGGGYGNANSGEGSFRDNVRDMDKQKALEQDDAITKTDSAVDQTIARRRAELEEMPEDFDRLKKLVEALLMKESEAFDEEAIKLLKDAWERSGRYSFKEWIGNIRMKQFNRQLHALKPAALATPEGSEDRKVYHELAQKKLQFELQEFAERVQNYPTDMGYKYELGKRLYLAKRFDEAISAFQQSKGDPKWRAASHEYLGQCFMLQGWLDEAIQTFQDGLDANPDEKREMTLRYLRLTALEQSAVKSRRLDQAREALRETSQIMQENINFRDIRQRMDKLRKLVEELEKEAR